MEHGQRKFESSRRHSRLSNTVLNLNGGTKFWRPTETQDRRGRAALYLLLFTAEHILPKEFEAHKS
jgi:hypothetical protein